MRILIHTQKGGVGKTTTTLNLAAALLRGGHARQVFMSDLDPQQHLTAMVVTDPAGAAPGGSADAAPVRGEPGLYLCAPDNAAADGGFPDVPATDGVWSILDTPPGWSDAIARAAARADLVLCPLEPDFLGLSGVGRLLRRLEDLGTARDRLRLLLTRYSGRLALHREVRDRLRADFADMLLPVEIRTSVRLAEAPGMGRTIFAYAPGSTGSEDHRALAAVLAGAPTPESAEP